MIRNPTSIAAIFLAVGLSACNPDTRPAVTTSAPATQPPVPTGYKFVSMYQCVGRFSIIKIIPSDTSLAQATKTGFLMDNYLQYRATIVDNLSGFSANDPSFVSALWSQVNRSTSYINVTVRAVAAAQGTIASDDPTLQFTPIVNAKRTTGQPADSFVAPTSYVYGPYVIANQNPIRFDVAYSYGDAVDTQLPGLITDAIQAGVAATGVGAIPVVAANFVRGITTQQKKDANAWFDKALSFDANKAAKPQCPVNFSSDEVVAGAGLYVRILDRDASDASAVVLVGFVIVPQVRRSLLVQANDADAIKYAAYRWDAQSFLTPIVGRDNRTQPNVMLSSNSTFNDTIYTKLRSTLPRDNVDGCRNLFATQPYLTLGFNKPDSAAINWSALRNAGSTGSRLTAETADNSEPPCPTDSQQARSSGASDLIDIAPPIGRMPDDSNAALRERQAARTANLNLLEMAFRGNALDVSTAGLANVVRVVSVISISGLPSDPQPYSRAEFADLFRSYKPRYVSNTEAVDGDTIAVKIRLGQNAYPGTVTFGPDNTVVGLSIGGQRLPAVALLSSAFADK